MNAILVDSKSGRKVNEGETVFTVNGQERGTLKTIRANEGKYGKIYVRLDGGTFDRCFYPSVIGAVFQAV